jgi:CMP-N-acetylneuraminic acid synthetase
MKLKQKPLIAIVPVKKKSRRLKNKNLKKIYNKTLVEITIDQLQSIKDFTEIYVSTNCKKTIQIALKKKCNVIIRPDHLCKDKSKANDVILHSINYISKKIKRKNFHLGYFQVTSPLRTIKNIKKCINLYKRFNGVVSVKKIDSEYLKTFLIKKNKISLIGKKNFLNDNSQFLPKLFITNGAIYIFNSIDFLKKRKIPILKMYPYIMSHQSSIDINTNADFEIAKRNYAKFYS